MSDDRPKHLAGISTARWAPLPQWGVSDEAGEWTVTEIRPNLWRIDLTPTGLVTVSTACAPEDAARVARRMVAAAAMVQEGRDD